LDADRRPVKYFRFQTSKAEKNNYVAGLIRALNFARRLSMN